MSAQESDPLSPLHYKCDSEAYEHWNVLEQWMNTAEFTGFLLGNASKYLRRWRSKNGVEDLQKAIVYINRCIQHIEVRESQPPTTRSPR